MKANLQLPTNFIKTINRYYINVIQKLTDLKKKNDLLNNMKYTIEIWLKFFSASYKKAFMHLLHPDILLFKVQIRKLANERHLLKIIETQLDTYVKRLHKTKNPKIFIGKDAFFLYSLYKQFLIKSNLPTDNAIFLKYSRSYLFGKSNDNNYIQLTELIYNQNINNSLKVFLKEYKSAFEHEKFYSRVRTKTLFLLKKNGILEKLNDSGTYTIIDSGMQGGLILPLISILDHEGYKGSFSLFYSFDWLFRLYRGKAFTKNPYIFAVVEREGAKAYERHSER